MSIADVTSRIQSIQSQLATLGTRPTTATAYAATAARAAATTTSSSVLDGAVDPYSLPGVDPSNVASDATTAGAGAVSGDDIVSDAKTYLGIPYLWGGTDPTKGLDCSGLVQRVYRDHGIELPRVSSDQARVGEPVDGLANAQPGDLLAFGSPVHHIAIYAGDGKMVEAPRTGLDVRVTDVYETPTAIRRVLGTSAAAGASAPAAASGPVDGVPYADLFNQAASTYGLDAKLLSAVAKQESGYDASAVSPAGAQGLMQLMPGTAQGLGVTDSFDPRQAVDGAAKLLSGLLARFDGSTQKALAAYNAGPGAVLRYDGVPPYPETQNYVRSIMAMVGAS